MLKKLNPILCAVIFGQDDAFLRRIAALRNEKTKTY